MMEPVSLFIAACINNGRNGVLLGASKFSLNQEFLSSIQFNYIAYHFHAFTYLIPT